jgi:carboxymethylenebutenolidase
MLNTTLKSHDGKEFGAYLARASKADAPSLVVIQEIFGVNPGLMQMADGWAKLGYHAIVPDLFWRLEPNLELSDAVPEQKKKAFDLYGKFDHQNGIKDLITTLAYARKLDGANGKAGTVGFCLGGNMAFQMAVHSDSDANVSYYGGGIDKDLGKVPEIKKPLMLHIGDADQYFSKDVIEKILLAVRDKTNIEMFVYPGANHAFARINGENFKADAAEQANARTREFFAKNLG